MSPDVLSLQAPELSLPIIIGFGLIDSINPCVIGVLLVMLSVLLKTGDRSKILKNGLSYTIGVYVTYLVGGLSLLSVFTAIRDIAIISRALYAVIGAFILLAALLEIKDYFWYGRWFSLAIPKSLVGFVEEKVNSAHVSLFAAAFFGGIVTLVELPCTGAPYLAILALMAQGGFSYFTALPLLLLYNLVFVFPLIAIILMVYFGFGIKRLEGWKQEHKGTMRLVIGLALAAVGIWIVTAVADYLLFPLSFGILGVIILCALLKYVFHFGAEAPVPAITPPPTPNENP